MKQVEPSWKIYNFFTALEDLRKLNDSDPVIQELLFAVTPHITKKLNPPRFTVSQSVPFKKCGLLNKLVFQKCLNTIFRATTVSSFSSASIKLEWLSEVHATLKCNKCSVLLNICNISSKLVPVFSPFFCLCMSSLSCRCSLLDERLGFSWEKVTVWPIKESYEEALDAPGVSVSVASHSKRLWHLHGLLLPGGRK